MSQATWDVSEVPDDHDSHYDRFRNSWLRPTHMYILYTKTQAILTTIKPFLRLWHRCNSVEEMFLQHLCILAHVWLSQSSVMSRTRVVRRPLAGHCWSYWPETLYITYYMYISQVSWPHRPNFGPIWTNSWTNSWISSKFLSGISNKDTRHNTRVFFKVTEVEVQNGNVSWHVTLLVDLEHSNMVSGVNLYPGTIYISTKFRPDRTSNMAARQPNSSTSILR
jgi:hypothetical protein